MCHHYRIPHSEFLSWSKLDRDKALWMWQRKASTCSGCGTRPEEWDPERGGHRAAYQAGETVCPGCARLHERQEWLGKRSSGKPPAGVKVHLTRRETT